MTSLNEVTADVFLFLASFRRRPAFPTAPPSIDREMFERDWLKNRLKNLLDLAERKATANPEAHRIFPLAKYALVVMADGVILNSGWSGAERWEQLEVDQYKTNNGGDRFFELIKDLQYRDPQLQELLFTCIAVGFAGKYADDAYGLKTERLSIFHGLPIVARAGEDTTSDRADRPPSYAITPAAYVRASGEGRRTLPLVSVLRMALVVLGVMVVLFLGAHLLYKNSVKDLITGTQKISESYDLGWRE